MRRNLHIILLLLSDIFFIFISILLAISIRKLLNVFFDLPNVNYSYITFLNIYIILIAILAFEGVYTKRFDFWHETKIIIRSSILSFIIIFANLALEQNTNFYSRTGLLFIFIISALILPISKFYIKRLLFRFDVWKKIATVISENVDFKSQLFDDPYLGYVRATGLQRGIIFIDGQTIGKEKLDKIIESNLRNSREIVFTPVLNGYDFSNSYIYNMFNSRTNIFTLENELLVKRNQVCKMFLDYTLVIMSMPIWLPVLLIIAGIIKKEDPNGGVLFKQERLGKNGKVFTCYKFRSMYTDHSFMEAWLKEHPEEKEYYDKYHKYINDPRVTRIGNILRKTSLDELPQLINVLKGEMSLVGPRPYMVTEKEDIGQKSHLVLAVKPGITGIWQVSGRSDVDFDNRVEMDIWYMKNWSLWNDIVILLKTIGTVLGRGGAR
ncbi:sugar transferase [Haemophilus paraphrohaemolyticus]|uniref:Bacterial sugar transferase n=1 Tax=Haemophilus paraphrohaemolyticus HK411 TaxID=1095743 RepID=I2NF10_9PAST|nr:sugar transferase [Haemophilus paraphrohaemolyticus]EIG24421.1 bacterial sugar transferase [Haemophilus paraphrohaemolyticus HK411]OOR95870.1 UDP-phosphate galactose phosphotransferase [Haemophilus paraphrohaemolyticus]STP00319.1 Putative colanic biosynthesis UDP-glucose lipid carrier transferase [Haemophilus paraphrohaemolyticus]